MSTPMGMKRTSERKPLRKKTDRQKEEKLLDDLFSELIRKRAIKQSGGCEKCGTQKWDTLKEDNTTFPAWKTLQCSHFIGRSTRATRWDEDNAFGHCGRCHMYLEHHPAEFVEWYLEKMGQQKYYLLMARSRVPARFLDRKLLIIYLRQELAKL